ncbi:MAG: proprotein convertase P, partial [Flavobacteriales bacterium]
MRKNLYLNLDKPPLMVAKLRLVFSFSILFICFSGLAQHGYWKQERSKPAIAAQQLRKLDISNGRLYSVDYSAVKRVLADRFTAKKSTKTLYFPDANGELLAFEVTEAPVLSPALSAKYPEIRSFMGHGLKDKRDKIRFSISHKGVQSMILHGDQRPATYMQMASKDTYLVYTRDGQLQKDIDFICETKSSLENSIEGYVQKPVDGQVLRKYRLAVSASGEYTQYHGGTVADALAAINATVTRINEVFETDLAVTLELVADTDKVIYTNSTTDPYEGNLNAEVQNALTTEIGEANYDIGHLFHKANNNGNAGFIGRICVDNQKGSAYAAAQTPEGDIFDLDFVAHEMGHQLGANHTWSFESEGTLVQFEPGSGTTIMGYAGITGINNVALNGDDYFHYISIVQIIENLKPKSCGELVPLANNPPVVDAGNDYIIPKSTAFALTGSATDADPADGLTYTWEEIDDGVVTQATFGPTNPSGANFRSLKPSASPTRYFPKLSRILTGNLTQTVPTVNSAWETVSNIEREMNFALTVRDNGLGGGQVVSDLVNIRVSNAAGPFSVTSQNSNETLTSGEAMDITWDVANTDLAPINAQNVDLLLSIDGGLSFPILLAEGVVNDGAHRVIIPATATAQARIMVKPQGNIFFAVNAVNFSILASEIVLDFPELEYDLCQPDDLIVPFVYNTYLGFTEEAAFSISSPPTGLDISFLPETAVAGSTSVQMTISNTVNVAPGSYSITVLATTASLSKEVPLLLNVYDSNFATVPLLSPLLLDHQANGREAVRMGNRNIAAAPHAVYRCKGENKWCVITVFKDEEWKSLCDVMGNPDWSSNTQFSTLLNRRN